MSTCQADEADNLTHENSPLPPTGGLGPGDGVPLFLVKRFRSTTKVSPKFLRFATKVADFRAV